MIFFMFLVVPLAYSVYTSFFTTRMIGGTVFTGFANYTQALESGAFWTGMARDASVRRHSGPDHGHHRYLFRHDLRHGGCRFGGAFRAVFFLPFAVPGVVATAMWGSMLQTKVGVFVRIFVDLGLPDPNFFGPGHLLGVIVAYRHLGVDWLHDHPAVHGAQVRPAMSSSLPSSTGPSSAG